MSWRDIVKANEEMEKRISLRAGVPCANVHCMAKVTKEGEYCDKKICQQKKQKDSTRKNPFTRND